MTLSIMLLCSVSFMLSVNYAECGKQAHYAECHYAECLSSECRYAECRGASLIFVCEARACHSLAPFRSSRARSWYYLQTLDKAGEANALAYSASSAITKKKSFTRLTPEVTIAG